MPRFFVLEIPERLSIEQSKTTEEYVRTRMRACGIEAQVLILDEGWRLTEVWTDGTVDANGTDAPAGDPAETG